MDTASYCGANLVYAVYTSLDVAVAIHKISFGLDNFVSTNHIQNE